MKNKYKAVIFDLDGTLLDTLCDLCDSTNAALRAFGYPERTIDEVRRFVGNGIGLLIERALPGGRENPDYEKVIETIAIEGLSVNSRFTIRNMIVEYLKSKDHNEEG